MKLNNLAIEDRRLIYHVSNKVSQELKINITEALKIVDESYLLKMLGIHNRFIHHEDIDKLVKNVIKSSKYSVKQ